MRIEQLLGGVLMLAGIVSAHDGAGIPGAPSIFGRRLARDLESQGPRTNSKRSSESTGERSSLEERQVGGTNGKCGPGVGSCAAGYCCGPDGTCAYSRDPCTGPTCQFNYGTGCDFWTVPAGSSTASIPRPQLGSVLYGGSGIRQCTTPNMIALTFDDGPYVYTQQVLNVLAKYNVHATFFIAGNNYGKGEIDNAAYGWSSLIQQMYAAGHQIASHSWTHQDFGSQAAAQGQEALTQQQRLNQMIYNEMAFRNILGVFPTYMRPPYDDCDAASGCQDDMANLGYHIIFNSLDTKDYQNDSPTLIQNSKDWYYGNISSNSEPDWLVLAHDVHEQTADNLTEYMITSGLSLGYTFGTVGDCLGDPQANWYRAASGGVLVSTTTGYKGGATAPVTSTASVTSTSASSVASPTAVSPDSTCGGTTGYTCQGSKFGNCCSKYGHCGSNDTYCLTGCQAAFGSCGAAAESSSSTAPQPTAVSPDSTCGGTTGYTCQGSKFGNCCSKYGHCGYTDAYCLTGCQAAFGSCGAAAEISPTSSKAPAPTAVSPDSTCGGTTGYTCQGSTFGNCCSKYGHCGSTSAYCGTGCQSVYGSCT